MLNLVGNEHSGIDGLSCVKMLEYFVDKTVVYYTSKKVCYGHSNT